jgi:phage repressor protein C with HTH and peptisase S24 domain
VADPPYIVRHLDVLETWARQVLGCVDPSRVKILTCNGDSMEPTINDQDIVFVDIGQPQFSRPGVYVLSIDDDLLIKRLNKKISGEIEVISDNAKHYRTETISAKDAATLAISGKVLGWWTLRKS